MYMYALNNTLLVNARFITLLPPPNEERGTYILYFFIINTDIPI